jgi:predicted aspartyl protease
MFKKTALLAAALVASTALQPVPKAHAGGEGAAVGIGLAAGLIGAAIAANAAAKQQSCQQWLPIVNDMRYDDGMRGYAAQIVAGCGVSVALMPRPAPQPVYAPQYAPQPVYAPQYAAVGQPTPLMSVPASQARVIEIPLERDGSAYVVTAVINGAGKLRMLLDTGADMSQIPLDVAKELAQRGALTINDIRAPVSFTIADGSSVRNLTTMLTITFGGRTATVRASIVSPRAIPLLGTDVLRQFGTYMVDNRRNVLVLTN